MHKLYKQNVIFSLKNFVLINVTKINMLMMDMEIIV